MATWASVGRCCVVSESFEDGGHVGGDGGFGDVEGELEVLVLGSLSVQAGQIGRHREAVAFASRAQDCPAAKRTPVALAMAAFREARAHALAKDETAAQKAMVRAEKAFNRAGSRPEWVAYLDEAELAAKFGFCWAALGKANRAVGLFRQALDGQRPEYQRNQALYSAYLAQAHLANNDVDQASSVGLTALDRTESVTSARALEQVAHLRHGLAEHRGLASAREYVEQFDARFPDAVPAAS